MLAVFESEALRTLSLSCAVPGHSAFASWCFALKHQGFLFSSQEMGVGMWDGYHPHSFKQEDFLLRFTGVLYVPIGSRFILFCGFFSLYIKRDSLTKERLMGS